MFVVGLFELTIDAKNRLSIPLAVREKMNPQAEGRGFYLTPGRRSGTIAVYPERPYEALRQQAPLSDDLSEEAYLARMLEDAYSGAVYPDEQGRILLPRHLLEQCGLRPGEAVLVGMRDHMVLWPRAEFQAFSREKWPAYSQMRARAQKEMRDLSSAAGAANGGAADRG